MFPACMYSIKPSLGISPVLISVQDQSRTKEQLTYLDSYLFCLLLQSSLSLSHVLNVQYMYSTIIPLYLSALFQWIFKYFLNYYSRNVKHLLAQLLKPQRRICSTIRERERETEHTLLSTSCFSVYSVSRTEWNLSYNLILVNKMF